MICLNVNNLRVIVHCFGKNESDFFIVVDDLTDWKIYF